MPLSMALTAPQYVAKAVSRKPLLMAGRDAGDEHAADERAPLSLLDRAAQAAGDEPLPPAGAERGRRRSRASMPETI